MQSEWSRLALRESRAKSAPLAESWMSDKLLFLCGLTPRLTGPDSLRKVAPSVGL